MPEEDDEKEHLLPKSSDATQSQARTRMQRALHMRGVLAGVRGMMSLQNHSRQSQCDMFGEHNEHNTSDHSMDVLGAHVAMEQATTHMMDPQEKIEYMRKHSPEELRAHVDDCHSEAAVQKHYSMIDAQSVVTELSSDLTAGLTQAAAEKRLNQYGPNELDKPKPKPFYKLLLKQGGDVILLLILAAGIVKWTGLYDQEKDMVTGAGMCCAALLLGLVNALGEYSSGSGLDGLAAAAAPVLCLRDGREQEVAAEDLVPGDIIQVKSGDCVPADGRVITCSDLRMDEILLTGESEEVTKTAEPLDGELPIPKNFVFSATNTIAGKATVVVTATGMKSQVGQIASRLEVVDAGLSPLQATMNKVGGLVGLAITVLLVTVTAICFFARVNDPASKCGETETGCFFGKALSRGIIMGISCVPATLPMMLTMILMASRKKICDHHANVKKTSSIETLGSCTVICSDKTGTLTEGKMTVVEAALLRKSGPAEIVHEFSFYPTAGFNPHGGVFSPDELTDTVQEQIKAKAAEGDTNYPIQNFAAKSHPSADAAQIRILLTGAALNSYSTELHYEDGKYVTVGNMSESALVVAAAKGGLGRNTCQGVQLEDVLQVYPDVKEAEVPFSSSRKMASTVHKVGPDGKFAGLNVAPGVSHVAIVKGAPDRLLPMVERTMAEKDGNFTLVDGFDDEAKGLLSRAQTGFANKALRVLLLCIREITDQEVKQMVSMEADDRMKMVTKKMAPVGAFGILDPPRGTVRDAIDKCHGAGIRVVMITGDQPPTAGAIGRNLRISLHGSKTKECKELHENEEATGAMKAPSAVDKLTRETNVWARAQPADKVAIVESLQRQGHTPAMTGDGVNDAPALKLADIGTAMGLAGSEVAKGSADIVLMDDDFTTIVSAVEEGRRAYKCIQTYCTFYLALSLTNILSGAAPIVVSGAIPQLLSDIQILLLVSLSLFIPPMMLMYNPTHEDNMVVAPRKKDSKLLQPLIMKWLVLPWGFGWSAIWVTCSMCGCWMYTGTIRNKYILGSDIYKAIDDEGFICEYAGVYRPVLVNLEDGEAEHVQPTGQEAEANQTDATKMGPVFALYTYPPDAQKKKPKAREQGGGYEMKYYADTEPFRCKCMARESPFMPPKAIEQWGVPILELQDEKDINEKCGERPKNGGESGPTDPGLGVWEQCVADMRASAYIEKTRNKSESAEYAPAIAAAKLPGGDVEEDPKEKERQSNRVLRALKKCEVPEGEDAGGEGGSSSKLVSKWCWDESVWFNDKKAQFEAEKKDFGETTGETYKHFNPVFERPLLDTVTNCGSQGVRSAMTMNFVAGMVANLCLVLSMSTERTICEAGCQNWRLVVAVAICGTAAFIAVFISDYVPHLEMKQLPMWSLLTAVAFAVVGVVILELLKIGYRISLRNLQNLRKFHAKAAAIGELSPWATDQEVREFMTKYPERVLEHMDDA
jgi:magnesium-transporting ATPase (P-type)